MSFLRVLSSVILIVIILFAVYQAYLWFLRKRSAQMISAMDLNERIRKLQLVDVREAAEFDREHILGARNIPFTQFKMRSGEIRRDLPVCLYDEGGNHLTSRAAGILKKQGHSQVYILTGGLEKWFGKTKTNLS